jgi:hypothetical protein
MIFGGRLMSFLQEALVPRPGANWMMPFTTVRALYLRSVCVTKAAFRGLKLSSADLHVVENTLS